LIKKTFLFLLTLTHRDSVTKAKISYKTLLLRTALATFITVQIGWNEYEPIEVNQVSQMELNHD
jgi:hypothetical protein